MEDASLSDFTDAGRGADAAGEAGGRAGDVDAADRDESGGETDATDRAEVDVSSAASPATITGSWRAEPTACEACGEPVRRVWRAGPATVCVDCADW